MQGVMEGDRSEASASLGASKATRQSASSRKEDVKERAQRCRERNRIHARKTRQRKKEQMQSLQSRAEDLKREQLRLRQIINEKNTASILVGLFAKSPINVQSSAEDPEVENLLKRPVDEIPDASKVSELPALILPGQHASKNAKALQESTADETEDGIDYELLGKDRSKCSPEELDRIRRERNRMHAKRTRDRKRLFTEQMSEICRQLEDENDALLDYLTKIDPDHNFVPSIPRMDQSSPTLAAQQEPYEAVDPCSLSDGGVPSNQLSKLLQAATAFEKPAASTAKRGRPAVKASSQSAPTKIPIPDILRSIASSLVALSDESSASDDSHDEEEHENMLSGSGKRQRTSSKYYSMSSPAATAVGC